MKTLGVIPVTNDKYFLSIFNLSLVFPSQYALLWSRDHSVKSSNAVRFYEEKNLLKIW